MNRLMNLSIIASILSSSIEQQIKAKIGAIWGALDKKEGAQAHPLGRRYKALEKAHVYISINHANFHDRVFEIECELLLNYDV